jgi:hypothetical protein
MFYRSNILNTFPIHAPAESKVGAVGSVSPPPPTGVDLYARFAFAGAVCCSVTHGALTPVDVVKTRIQLEPEVYNKVGLFPPIDTLSPPCRVLQRRNAANVRHGVGFPTHCKNFAGRSLILQTLSHVTQNMPADAGPPIFSREWYLHSARLFGTRVLGHC